MGASNTQKTRKFLQDVDIPQEFMELTKRIFSVPASKHSELKITLEIINIINTMENVKYDVDDYGNLLITKGDAKVFPCFVAHMDTVHDYSNGFKISISKDNIIEAYDNKKKRVGCGGDDKCGIVICLYLLQTQSNIKVALFTGEESGGVGSGGVDLKFFSDCAFIGGIDRWGNSDFVTDYMSSETISKVFKKDIQPFLDTYGYSDASGLFTDSFNLFERGVGISCFNMSCGYYSHHTNSENVDVNEMFLATRLATKIATVATKRYTKKYSYSTSYRGWGKSTYAETHDTCVKCNKPLTTFDSSYYYCNACLKTNFPDYKTPKQERKEWNDPEKCPTCGIELLPYETTYCETCERDKRVTCSECGCYLLKDEVDTCENCRGWLSSVLCPICHTPLEYATYCGVCGWCEADRCDTDV